MGGRHAPERVVAFAGMRIHGGEVNRTAI